MAIEPKTYTAGNSDGKLSSVIDYIRLFNDEENNIPNTPTIISVTDKKTENMFNNTSGVTIKEYEIEAQRASNQAEDLQLGGKLWEKEEQEKEEADKVMEFAERGIEEREAAERKAQEERAEIWANSDHTYAGLNMSASQWLAAIDWFQDEDNVAAWEDQIMSDTGMSRKDAKRVGGKMKHMYDLIKKESEGKILSDSEKTELKNLSDDSEVKKGVSAQQKIQSFQRNQVGVAPISEENETHLDSSISKNAASIATALSDLNYDIDVKKGVFAQQEISSLHKNNAISNGSETGFDTTRTKSTISLTSILSDGGSVGETNNVKSITPAFNHVAPDTKIVPPTVEIKVGDAPKLANTTVVLSADNMFG